MNDETVYVLRAESYYSIGHLAQKKSGVARMCFISRHLTITFDFHDNYIKGPNDDISALVGVYEGQGAVSSRTRLFIITLPRLFIKTRFPYFDLDFDYELLNTKTSALHSFAKRSIQKLIAYAPILHTQTPTRKFREHVSQTRVLWYGPNIHR